MRRATLLVELDDHAVEVAFGLVVEERGHDGAIVVLERAAALLRAGQRDCSQVAQHADVMTHGREWLIEDSCERAT
jgi:hypothetical protein